MGLFTKSNTATPGGAPSPAKPTSGPATASSRTAAPPMITPSPQATERQVYLQQLKVRIHQQLVERLDMQNLRALPPETVRGEVRILVRDLCQSEKGVLKRADQEKLMDDIMDETFGLGPLEVLLKDPTISDILVNKFDRIYVERRGRLEQ